MTFYAGTKREMERIRMALETMTGYQPSVFRTDTGSYRVQENEYGSRWEEALTSLLDAGVRADQCSRERVAAEMERMGL